MVKNVQNCINKQRHLPMHPKWWDKYQTEEDLVAALNAKGEEWSQLLSKYEGYANKTASEHEFMADLRKYIRILKEA